MLFAQIFGIMGMASNILSYQFKEKKILILLQLIGSAFFAVNMFMLGAMMGGILNVVGIIRALVFAQKDRLKIPVRVLTSVLFLIYILSYIAVFTVLGKEPTWLNLAVELLPIIGMAALTVGLARSNAKAIRACGFINSPCWLVYNIVNRSIGGIVCEIISVISIALAFVRLDLKTNEGEDS